MLRLRGGVSCRLLVLAVLGLLPAMAAGQSANGYVAPPAWAVGGGFAPAPKPAAKVEEKAEKVAEGGIPPEQRDCRFCHQLDEAELNAQPRLAQRKHRRALDRGRACDRCHDAEEMCCHELIFAKLEKEDDD